MSPTIGSFRALVVVCMCVPWMAATVARAGDPLDDVVDQIRDMTSFQNEKGDVSLDFDFYATVDNWVISQPPPGIMVTGQNYLNSPRLSMLGTLQVQEWLSIFALGDVDRGFDPTDGSIQIRPDVYYAKISPFGGILQGKFGAIPTSYGQWVNRHFSWQNPLVNAPLAYEWFMGIRGTRRASRRRPHPRTAAHGSRSSGDRATPAAGNSTERSTALTGHSSSRMMRSVQRCLTGNCGRTHSMGAH